MENGLLEPELVWGLLVINTKVARTVIAGNRVEQTQKWCYTSETGDGNYAPCDNDHQHCKMYWKCDSECSL